MKLILLVFIAQVFSIPRKIFPRPEKPGFYEIVSDGAVYSFKKLPKDFVTENVSKINEMKSGSSLTGWDFSLLNDSVQAQNVLNMGMCGDDYVLVATDVVGVAAYLNSYNSSNPFNDIISHGYEVACEGCFVAEGKEFCQMGCGGGLPEGVLKFIADRGAVLKKCISAPNPTDCPEKCDDGSEIEFYQDSNFHLVTAYNEKVSFLRDLLVSSGPCIAEMYVHNNLMHYTGEGIYKMPEGTGEEPFMDHVAVVYGFGVEDGQPYWLAKNTWGEFWGSKGYFKIEMGKNDSGFEEYFMCINNNVRKGPYPMVPTPFQPDYVWTDTDTDIDTDTDTDTGTDDPSGDAFTNPHGTKKNVNATAIVVPIVVVVVVAVVVVVLVVYFRTKKRRGGNGSEPNVGLQVGSGSSSNSQGNEGGDVITEEGFSSRYPRAPFTDNVEPSVPAVSSGHAPSHFTDIVEKE